MLFRSRAWFKGWSAGWSRRLRLHRSRNRYSGLQFVWSTKGTNRLTTTRCRYSNLRYSGCRRKVLHLYLDSHLLNWSLRKEQCRSCGLWPTKPHRKKGLRVSPQNGCRTDWTSLARTNIYSSTKIWPNCWRVDELPEGLPSVLQAYYHQDVTAL